MADDFIDPNYIEVSERIATFREKYPKGSFQTCVIPLPAPFDEKFVAVEARAYRTPDDERPGVDVAWEPVPGKTNFTKDSELMNASTSAVGRAIVYALAADTHKDQKVASANEVRNRQNGEPTESADKPKISPKQLSFLVKLLKEAGVESSDINMVHSWALDNLSGGRSGSASAALEGMKNEPDTTVERLLEAALKWQSSQSDLTPEGT